THTATEQAYRTGEDALVAGPQEGRSLPWSTLRTLDGAATPARLGAGGDQNVHHGARLAHRPPPIVGLSGDREEHLVEMPLRPRHADGNDAAGPGCRAVACVGSQDTA